MPEIRRLLVLSTGHLTRETRAWLDGLDFANAGPVGGSYSGSGWFLYAHEDNADFPASAPHAPEGQYPDDLWAVFVHARALGCENILFDCDAERIDGLPYYETESSDV